MRLKGRCALVTGGSRGIGRAVCLELAREGADVALVYRSREAAARETAEAIEAAGVRGLAIQADVADWDAVSRAIDWAVGELGKLDLLVHSAGAEGVWKPARELTAAEWSSYVGVDLNGAFNAIRAVLPHMHARREGVIVAISSIAAQMCQARNAQGAAAKAGLEALIRVVAREEGRHGIRANAVAVGLTETDMARTAFERWGPEATARVVGGIPAGRIGRPEEVARVVSFLASEDGAYITGKVIQVDGGQFIGG
ncbi:MAG: SDR family NAD(P)-dependent oxidoreductase [Candidatus Rokuibacteriota bacterium]